MLCEVDEPGRLSVKDTCFSVEPPVITYPSCNLVADCATRLFRILIAEWIISSKRCVIAS
jgi:hypothetical protein